MLGVFADLLMLQMERQTEAKAAAKACGVYKGRRPKLDASVVDKLRTGRSSVRPILRNGSPLARQVSIACVGRREWHSHANPPGTATPLSSALA